MTLTSLEKTKITVRLPPDLHESVWNEVKIGRRSTSLNNEIIALLDEAIAARWEKRRQQEGSGMSDAVSQAYKDMREWQEQEKGGAYSDPESEEERAKRRAPGSASARGTSPWTHHAMDGNVRLLPEVQPRVETGPVRFTGDWAGLYLRGEQCVMISHALDAAIAALTQPGAVEGYYYAHVLEGALQMIRRDVLSEKRP